MDYLGGAAATLANVPSTSVSGGHLLERLLGVAVAVAVLRLEVMRRTASLPYTGSGRTQNGYFQNYKKLFRQHAPEAVGLTACLAFAVALRIHCSPGQVVDDKTWAEIVRQWPILLTADSLLALQVMLRVLVLASAVLRAGPHPLGREAALIFLVAAVGRVTLAMRSDVYKLDGPLGGCIPIAFEIASVPLLAVLCRGVSKQGFSICTLTTTLAICLAYRNRLSLANDTITDGLFIFAHIAELIAAFAFLCRSITLDVSVVAVGKNGVAVRFAHALMLVQQCLAAYYFVQAFEYNSALVSAGKPFEVLQIGNVAQLGAFAAAAVLHVAECQERESLEE
jgi:hypothetical protein